MASDSISSNPVSTLNANASSLLPSSPVLIPSSLNSSTTVAVSLLSGATAGLSVDLVLFPLDTIKTRMQSKGGFQQTGGFKKLFSGIASAAAGSAPTAALFFLTYESSKAALTPMFHPPRPADAFTNSPVGSAVNPLVHCLSASAGEVVACLIRVPTENVKQKVQAGLYRSSFECFQALARFQPTTVTAQHAVGGATTTFVVSHSPLSNFYRGFGTTILREIPFAFVQFPLYEWSKQRLAVWLHARQRKLDGWMCACLGSAAGGVAAAVTTPLDVVKTRLMLQASTAAADPSQRGIAKTFRNVYREGGVSRLFAGIVPRVMWISIGGFVFFGAYESTKSAMTNWYDERQ